jgi:hypothetical protein
MAGAQNKTKTKVTLSAMLRSVVVRACAVPPRRRRRDMDDFPGKTKVEEHLHSWARGTCHFIRVGTPCVTQFTIGEFRCVVRCSPDANRAAVVEFPTYLHHDDLSPVTVFTGDAFDGDALASLATQRYNDTRRT